MAGRDPIDPEDWDAASYFVEPGEDVPRRRTSRRRVTDSGATFSDMKSDVKVVPEVQDTDVLALAQRFGRASEIAGEWKAEEGDEAYRAAVLAGSAGDDLRYALQALLAPKCSCGNVARYVSANGLCCGTCPIRKKQDSIRISDVPRLLQWARQHLLDKEEEQRRISARMNPVAPQATPQALREIIGRKP